MAKQKLLQRVKKAAGRVVGNVALAPLLPVLPAAMAAYKAETGKNPPLEPLEFVKAFHRDILVPRGLMGKGNRRGKRGKRRGKSYDLDPVTIGAIVSAILSFLQGIKKKSEEKKARGEALSPAEEKALQSSVEDAQNATADPAALAQVGELLPLMREYYREQKGKALPSDPLQAARVFYTEIVVPSSQSGWDYDLTTWSLPEYEVAYDYYGFDIGTALNGIVAFFRSVRDRVQQKKAQGKPVSKTEEKIAATVDKVEREVRSEVEATVQQDIQQGMGKTITKLLPVAAIGLAAYLLFAKKR
jgi:hypothetical protein